LVLTGCVWDTRAAMIGGDPQNPLVPDWEQVLRDLAINSILLHAGSTIDPSIYVDWLILDDDNGNLLDGTPHKDQIFAGFDGHKMVPAFFANATGAFYNWTDDDSANDWNDCRNWNDQTAPCGSNYPQNAGDVAFIDGSTSNESIELVDETIRKLAISRDIEFNNGGSGAPTLHVRVLTLFALAPANGQYMDITITAAAIK
jgi:hypothetical protein